MTASMKPIGFHANALVDTNSSWPLTVRLPLLASARPFDRRREIDT
jgi:hypothetical protein